MADSPDTRRRGWLIVVVAIVGGLLLGPIDLLAQRALPCPWANLANSSAVWAIAAFGVGLWVGAGRGRPAIAGVVLLVVFRRLTGPAQPPPPPHQGPGTRPGSFTGASGSRLQQSFG